MNLDGYGQTVSALRNASRGSYGGPSVSETALRRAYESVDGVDTGELRAGARLAAGSTETAGVQQWLLPVVKFIGSLGAGMLATELVERAQSWFSSRDEAEEISDATDRAADAIDTTLTESDRGAEAILLQLVEIIAQISAHLSTIDPREHPEAFAAVVQAGSDIINDAAAMILGLCADRDRAIEECYRALIDHGQRVCERPDPTLADAVSGGEVGGGAGGSAASSSVGSSSGSSTGASGGAVGSSGSGVAEKVMTTPASVTENPETKPDTKSDSKSDSQEESAEKKAVEKPADKSAEKEEPAPDSEQDCEEKPEEKPVVELAEDCVDEGKEPEDEPEPELEVDSDPAPVLEEEPEGHRIREIVIGAIGVGLVIAGVSAIAHFLEQAVQEALAAMNPEIEVPVEATPELEPEPVVKPVPPAPEPVNDKNTEAELADVPEPPAKPIPAAVPADYKTGPVAASAAAPAPVTPVHVSEQVAAPSPVPAENAGLPRVRKAGGWS